MLYWLFSFIIWEAASSFRTSFHIFPWQRRGDQSHKNLWVFTNVAHHSLPFGIIRSESSFWAKTLHILGKIAIILRNILESAVCIYQVALQLGSLREYLRENSFTPISLTLSFSGRRVQICALNPFKLSHCVLRSEPEHSFIKLRQSFLLRRCACLEWSRIINSMLNWRSCFILR